MQDEKIASDLIVAEYNSLKSEILARARFRFTLSTTAIVGAGVFIGLENRYDSVNEVVLIYPTLLLFLAAGWLYQLRANLNINRYLVEISEKYGVAKWEKNLADKSKENKFNFLGTFSQGWMFCFLQIMCIAVAFENVDSISEVLDASPKCWFMIITALLSSILTLLIVWENHKAKGSHA